MKMNNTNTEEWGNIELPGLSDEKLLSTNWHHVAVNRINGKKNEHRENTAKNNLITWQDSEKRANRLKGLRLANLKPEVIERKTQANRMKTKDTEWRQKTLQNIMSRAKPIIDNNGLEYESLAECARKLGKAIGTVQYYLKKGKFRYKQ